MKVLPIHLLYPADIFVNNAPYLVSTVLGSCISVCLHDPMLGHGAINHYILPHWNGSDLATMKYGNLAIIRILEELLKLGSKYENLNAKVIGGAEMLTGAPTNFHIGKRNTQIAIEILKELKIPVLFSDVGGNRGRRICFNTLSGEIKYEFIGNKEKVLDIGIKEDKNMTGNFFKRVGIF